MKVYAISQNYEGIDTDWVFSNKEDAEQELHHYVYYDREYPLDINEFKIIEIEVK